MMVLMKSVDLMYSSYRFSGVVMACITITPPGASRASVDAKNVPR